MVKGKPAGKPRKQRQKAPSEAAPQAQNVTTEAAASPATAAGVGHNSGAETLNDKDLQALTVHHKGKYVESLANKKKYDKEFRDACKKAVADLGDNAVDDIKDMILLETEEGEAKIKAQIDRRMRIARWMALPLGVQSDFLWQPDRTPLVDRAKAEGFMAGLSGNVNCMPPYDGEPGQAWISAWHDGQAKRVRENIKPTSELKPAATSEQSSFDDALPNGDSFMPAPPDHASDPASPANPINAKDAVPA